MYLDTYIGQIKKLCIVYQVKHLYAFGSVLTDKFNTNLDIDLLVDFNSKNPIEYAENYFELKFKLEDLLNRPIDLLEEKGLKSSYLIQNINSNKKNIHGTRN